MNSISKSEASLGNLITETTIGKICDKFSGDVQTGPFGSQLHASDYSDFGIPVVMPQDMADGRVGCDRIARVSEKHVSRLSRHRLLSGDIVYSRRGDVGRFAIITDDETGWLCGTGSIRIRLNCPEIDIRYVRRYLQQSEVSGWLEREAKGVTMPNLNTKIIRELPFVYPPLPEQRRIAAILDQADVLRAKRRAALAQLDEMAQAIFVEMFGDPITNRKNLPMVRLGDIAIKFSDGPFGSNLKSSHYVEEGVRVIRLQNIGEGTFVDRDRAFIAEAHFQTLARHECKPGDILVGTLGDPNLRACIQPDWLEKALNKADCVQIRVDPKQATAEYVEALLNHPSTEQMAQDRIVGQTRLRISMGRLREMSVMVPPLAEQKIFSERVVRVRKIKNEILNAQTETEALFASLQHRAFRGEL